MSSQRFMAHASDAYHTNHGYPDASRPSPSDAGEDDHFDPRDYKWEFRPPGIQDVQTLVDIIRYPGGRFGDDADSDPENHIKRISNKFFVYRSHFLRAYRNVVDPTSGQALHPVPQRHISKLAGHVWKEVLTEEQREPYHLAYLQLKAEFEAKHPDYRYRPKTKEEKERLREKQKEKRAQIAEVRRAQRKERELEDNRRRVAAGYSHRAWRKLKKEVRNGMPDPLAHLGGCLNPGRVKEESDDDDDDDDALEVPEVHAPALPSHLTEQVVQAAQLLEKNEDMRASQAWIISANPAEIPENQKAKVEPNGPIRLPPITELPYPGPAANDSNLRVRELGFRLSQVGLQETDPSNSGGQGPVQPTRLSFSDSFPLLPPLPLHGPTEQAGPSYGARSHPGPSYHGNRNAPHSRMSMMHHAPLDPIKHTLRELEQALLADPLQMYHSAPSPRTAIQFGRTDPGRMAYSTHSETSTAKRRRVAFQAAPSPRSLREDASDPVRGRAGDDDDDPVRGAPRYDEDDPVRGTHRDEADDPVRATPRSQASYVHPGSARDERMQSADDVVRGSATPNMSERMAPSTSTSPFQRSPHRRLGLGRPSHRSTRSEDGRRLPSFALFSKLSGLANGDEAQAPSGKGKRRLSPDAQGGRSRQPSMAFGVFTPPASSTSRSRQPSMVVGLVDGNIALISREDLERMDRESITSPGGSTGSSTASITSEPRESMSGRLPSTSRGKIMDMTQQIGGDPAGKNAQAYKLLTDSLTAILQSHGNEDMEAQLGPRMSFSDFISSLPEHMAPDPDTLQSLQAQLTEDEGNYQSLLQYSGWAINLEDLPY